MIISPNFEILKQISYMYDHNTLNTIFYELINILKAYLNLDVVNKNVEIRIINEKAEKEGYEVRFDNVVKFVMKDGLHLINFQKKYAKFYPFLMLHSAYLLFIPDHLKKTKFINFAINQFIEFDLQEFKLVNEWSSFIRKKYIDYTFLKNDAGKFRFSIFFELADKKSIENPKRFFFEYVRRFPKLSFDDDLKYINVKIYEEFLFKTSKTLQNDEVAETLRIITYIFYRIKDCDTLLDYYKHFKRFKNQEIIQTDLSFRKFKKNLQWLNKFSRVAPIYYLDWKALNIVLVACHIKFSPLLEKSKVDKIINNMPFLIMPKLSVSSFLVEFSAYLVIPKIYLKRFSYMLEQMNKRGYIIEKRCLLLEKYEFSLNINYFRDFYEDGHIINFNANSYSKRYELVFNKRYSTNFRDANLNLLDFLIIDRLRFFTYVGLTFSRKTEIANVIKSDWIDYYTSENRIIKKLKKNFLILKETPELQKKFLDYLKENQRCGFFHLKYDLEKWVNYLQILEKETKGPSEDFVKFKEFYEKENVLKIIEEREIFDSIDFNSTVFKNLFHSYLNDKENYEKESKKFRFYYQFLSLCSELKIFSLISVKKLVSEPELLKNIAKTKEKRLRDIKKYNKIQNATSTSINLRITELLKKKIIKPYLIASIWSDSLASYFPQVILKNTPEVRVIMDEFKNYFPKVYFYEGVDLFDEQEYIFFQFFVPFLNNNEKALFISILSNLFKENLISFKRFSWDGFLHTFSRKDFYDFQKKEFFYTRDLFDQYFLYVRRILGEEINTTPKKSVPIAGMWPLDTKMSKLVKTVNQRIVQEKSSFNLNDILKLINFNQNLEKILLNKHELKLAKNKAFFTQHVKSIKLFPTFKKFGFGQFLLYVTPFDFSDVDLKLLFSNTFQSVKHIASVDSSNSLLIKYLFPYNDPNTSYLNWLAKSKKNIREYCLFEIKSISQILHFNTNLGSNGWNLDPNNLKTHIQNVLFNPNYKAERSEVKEFNVGDLLVSEYYKPNSPYFEALKQVYSWKSMDVKEQFDTMGQPAFDEIKTLIKEKLVHPYITLKNLGFREKIHIFLLNLEEDTIDVLKMVFQFFNLAYIYDVEGAYYIHGFKKEKKFKRGMLIKLYLPECELSEILRTLEYIFQYLKVERYLILTDLVEGKTLLETVYGNRDFLKDYNPLDNLLWTKRTHRWRNHKLFNELFESIYPDLISKEK